MVRHLHPCSRLCLLVHIFVNANGIRYITDEKLSQEYTLYWTKKGSFSQLTN